MIGKRTVLMLLLAFSACTTIVPTVTAIQRPTATLTPSAIPTGTPTLDPFSSAERIQHDIDNQIWIRVQREIKNDEPKFYKIVG
jgi:hypothetical protein